MKTEDLQRLIKTYVRQALNEALAEKYLQNIVKEAVTEVVKVSLNKVSLNEVQSVKREAQPQRRNLQESVAPRAAAVAKNFGPQNSIMEEIFRDTLASNNPILTGEEGGNPNDISEDTLEKVGVFNKDWSKYIK